VAYEFDRTVSQRVYLSSAPISAYPITISMWAYPDASYIGEYEWQTGVGVFNDTNDFICLYTEADWGPTPAGAVWYGGNSDSFTGWTIEFQEWSHILASSSSDSNHRLVLHGTDVDTSTTAINGGFPWSPNISIGGNTGWTSETMVGRIAEVGIWNTAHLTVGEEQALASGVSPLLIRPDALVAYVPLVRDTRDPIGGTAWSTSLSPDVGVHAPEIIYPSAPEVGVIDIGSRTLYAWTMHNAESAGSNTAAAGFRNRHPVRLFDDTTQEYIHFYGVMPRRALRDRLGVKLTWTSAATSGDVRWGCVFERHEDDATDLDSNSWGDYTYRSADAPSSAGISRQAYIRLGGRRNLEEIDSLEPGESFRLSITRTPASDSMADDAELKNVELVEVL